jgi:hypothetical protein
LPANLPTAAPTTAASEGTVPPGFLALNRSQPSATAEGELIASGYGKQKHKIIVIDVTGFYPGGR